MCSRAVLNRTRFAKQREKKPLALTTSSLKTTTPLPSYSPSPSTPTAASSALRGKMFKNRVLVTSGEQGAVVGETLDRGISKLTSHVCVCVPVFLWVTQWLWFANGSEWLWVKYGWRRRWQRDGLCLRANTHMPSVTTAHFRSAMCLCLLSSNCYILSTGLFHLSLSRIPVSTQPCESTDKREERS